MIAERALWYLAMSRLLEGDAPGAIRHLEKLRDMQGSYLENARDLLGKLGTK